MEAIFVLIWGGLTLTIMAYTHLRASKEERWRNGFLILVFKKYPLPVAIAISAFVLIGAIYIVLT